MSPTEPPVDGQEVSQSTGGTRVGKDRVDSHSQYLLSNIESINN